MFKKILIANRGEIALRILRACKEMGIKTVVVHSTADSEAMYVKLADESVCIGAGPSANSYLNIPAILAAAEISGADALHPGIGFLSENRKFAEMVMDHGMVFIGPSPAHLEMMGDKVNAKQKAQELGLKVIPGSYGKIESPEEAKIFAENIGFPVLFKARSGGGGKGMRIIRSADVLKEGFEMAKVEAQASFGDDSLYMEKYLERPRHIELQMLGDIYNNVICLGERDCSLQKNHQKIWEESPSPILNDEERQKIYHIAIEAMKKFGYYSAGTLEFLYENGEFFFIEMNTRLQVEHPITEMVTGIDLVKEQIRIAANLPLKLLQKDVQFTGHAIECRINAEDPKNFMPQPGKIETYLPPGGPGIRIDSALFSGYTIPPFYDSLIAKLIAHGSNRKECISKLQQALSEYVISGIKTLIPLHLDLCQAQDILEGIYDINWLERFISSNITEKKAYA